jgi:hypothetical protein
MGRRGCAWGSTPHAGRGLRGKCSAASADHFAREGRDARRPSVASRRAAREGLRDIEKTGRSVVDRLDQIPLHPLNLSNGALTSRQCGRLINFKRGRVPPKRPSPCGSFVCERGQARRLGVLAAEPPSLSRFAERVNLKGDCPFCSATRCRRLTLIPRRWRACAASPSRTSWWAKQGAKYPSPCHAAAR